MKRQLLRKEKEKHISDEEMELHHKTKQQQKYRFAWPTREYNESNRADVFQVPLIPGSALCFFVCVQRSK